MTAPGRLRHRVGETIASRGLWRAGDRVVVAVSGGLDSVVLLDLLLETRGWHGGALAVATVDHGTRADSAADADFVADLAAAHGIELHRTAAQLGEGASEDRCRRARYAFLESLEADAIALAHHRDDQAETVLVQLLRGTGTRGLAGMGWRRGRIVRPLLDVPRSALQAWASHRGLAWREDPGNTTPSYLRNRVRHEVIPLLEALRPGATEALARSARAAAADADLIAALVPGGADGWPLAWFAETAEPLARRALLDAEPSLGNSHVDALLALVRRGAGALDLPGGRRAVIAGDRLIIEPVEQKSTRSP